MKVISLHQPWASLVVLGAKKYETRSWPAPPSAIGPLLIHAAKKTSKDQVRFFLEPDFCKALQAGGYTVFQDLPLGAIVGQVELVKVWRTSHVWDHIDETEEGFGDFSEGRFAWEFKNPKWFSKPIPYRGAQGFFKGIIYISTADFSLRSPLYSSTIKS